MQFQRKLMNQTRENGKKNLVLDTTLAHLAQIPVAKSAHNLYWQTT